MRHRQRQKDRESERKRIQQGINNIVSGCCDINNFLIPATLADDIESPSATNATLSTADAPVIIIRMIINCLK